MIKINRHASVKAMEGINDMYQIFSDGRCYSNYNNGTILKPFPFYSRKNKTNTPHFLYSLTLAPNISKRFYVSRLVMFYFGKHDYNKIEEMPPVTFVDQDSSNVNIGNLRFTTKEVIVQKNYYKKKSPEPLIKWGDEEWRYIKPKNPIFEKLYMISNYGRVKRVARTFERESWSGTTYTMTIPSAITKSRYIGKNLAVTLNKKHLDKRCAETIYIARAVAQAFIPNPHNLTHATLKNLDDKENYHVSNIMWVDQSYLSLRSMEMYPELRNQLRDHNIKSGYYEKLSQKQKNE